MEAGRQCLKLEFLLLVAGLLFSNTAETNENVQKFPKVSELAQKLQTVKDVETLLEFKETFVKQQIDMEIMKQQLQQQHEVISKLQDRNQQQDEIISKLQDRNQQEEVILSKLQAKVDYCTSCTADKKTRSDDSGPLETVVAQATQRLNQHEADIRALQNAERALETAIGTTYIRWGSASCNNISELVYSGSVGGGHYNEAGDPPNYLCLPPNPIYDGQPFPIGHGAVGIYGGEYDISHSDPVVQMTPACSVCRIPRATTVMIPVTNQCGSGWHLEYSGHIMAGSTDGSGTNEYVCVDSKQDYIHGTQRNDDQNVFHSAITKCGSLSCPPYQDNKIATCVVCSK